MRRRAFQFALAAAFAFALALAVLLGWGRSYQVTEKIEWQSTGGWRCVRTAAGHVEVSLLMVDWSGQPARQFYGPRYERGEVRGPFNHLLLLCSSRGDRHIDWEYAGFAWHAKLNFLQGVHHSIAVVPCWYLAVASLSLPTILVTRRRLRAAAGI